MGKQWKQWETLFWGSSKITADGDYSHEIKLCLPLGRKAMTNLLLLLLSRFSRVRLFETPWPIACQAPLSMGFSRQEYWRDRKSTRLNSSHITSWQIDGETMKTVRDFILGGFKITADGDCSHESKRRLPLGRKAMTNLDSLLKSRHYFADKGLSS